MDVITSKQRQTAIRILATAFQEVPGVLWILKKDGKFEKRLRSLCNFCLNVSMDKKGAFITSDGKGVVLIFKNSARQNFIRQIWRSILLCHNCIGWERVKNILARERIIRSRRIKQEHLYFWMLAVEDNSNGLNTIIEMRDFSIRLSQTLDLPIVAETTLKRNVVMYQRYGYRVYDEWKVDEEGLTVWFMIRDVKKG